MYWHSNGSKNSLISLRSLLKRLPAIRDVVQERDALRGERDALLHERDTLLCERNALRSERDTVLRERNSALVRLGVRSAYLSGVDTIDAIRHRHADFDQVRE